MLATLLQILGLALVTTGLIVAFGLGGVGIVVGIAALLTGIALEGERV